MKILFIGCVKFSAEILKIILINKFDVVGIITKDDTGFNSDYFDLSTIANQSNIPYIKSKNVNEVNILEWVKKLNPDITYCFGWNSLIKEEFISLTKSGVIGYHPASLPYNRGRHPIIWSIVLGLTETASTFFYMTEGADDGDIVSQIFINISEEDNSESLYSRLIEIAKIQVLDFTTKFQNTKIEKIKQDNTISNYWRKRTKLDGIIDFRMSSKAIYNLVRALTYPYPGASIITDKGEFKIWKAIVSQTNFINYEPGKIIEKYNENYLVKCGLYKEAILINKHDITHDYKIGDYFI